MITSKELSMDMDEQMAWMKRHLITLSEALRVIELLIRDEKEDLYDHIPGKADIIKDASEYFMDLPEQLESMGLISLFDKSLTWYEDIVSIAVSYDNEPSVYRKIIHDECNHVIKLWNDMVYMLMN